MNDVIKQTRIENLKRWYSGKTLPPKDKSLISQLMSGKISFGEKVSRRLEADYSMGTGYLDTPISQHNQSNVSVGGDNVNGNVTIHEMNRYNTVVDSPENGKQPNFVHDITLKTMPLLDIDDAVCAILYPEKIQEKIKNVNERVASFVSNQYSTVGVKIADNSIKNTSDNHIVIGDIAIVEPALMPRSNDIVLVCLDARSEHRRGIFAQLKIDLSNQRSLISDDFPQPIKMPSGSVICGVVIEVKRRLVDVDVVHSRYEPNHDIWQNEQT